MISLQQCLGQEDAAALTRVSLASTLGLQDPQAPWLELQGAASARGLCLVVLNPARWVSGSLGLAGPILGWVGRPPTRDEVPLYLLVGRDLYAADASHPNTRLVDWCRDITPGL